MQDGDLRLRPLRMFDSPFILRGLNEQVILKASGLSKPIASLWFFVWWWMKKTFTPAYCIECDSRRIGFIGLYNLIPGKSAEMSLVIFDKNNRRMGYGTRAFNIFAQGLKQSHLIGRVIVKIIIDNHAAISFYEKLGFEESYSVDGIRIMSKDLDSASMRNDKNIYRQKESLWMM